MSRTCQSDLFRVMGPPHSSEAIVLRTRAYGESDKIVTFLTVDSGKLTGIAKGAKNSRRRFANCLDPFTRVRVHFRTRPGAGLVFMDSCDLLLPPGALATPIKFAYGSYLLELVDQFTAEAQPAQEIYSLLAAGLEEIENAAATGPFLRAFELRLLHYCGYEPQLTTCSECQRSVGPADQALLDAPRGRIVCATCGTRTPALLPVSGTTLTELDAIKTATFADARQHRFSPTTANEAAQLLGHLMAQHLPRPLRSVSLIAALAR